MRLRYEHLFSIDFTTAYYVDMLPHGDFVIVPTCYCVKQMSRFKMLSKKTINGMSLIYECSPFTNDATPFRPVNVVEKFTFKVTVANPEFWYYADVNNWERDKIFLLKNPFFNTTGDINVLTGPLNATVLFRPMQFKHELVMENVPGLLKVLDATGNVLRTIIVRARTVVEPVGKKEALFVDLKNSTDGSYTLRHVTSGGDVDEAVYCSEDYSTDTLAIVEISYQSGLAWTGIPPFQRYVVNITSRATDWFFDVHIRKKAIPPYLASQLKITHVPVPPEPLRTFAVVGVADDVNGFVQFKSNVKLTYSQRPMQLQLQKVPATTVLDTMPLPSSITVQKDALNNIITKIVVNV
ncbi:hypothetical protein [Segetibacter aerophilus]|uniref:Uncharacterized protein n=1 Tax=Segetibacter aerophilus TaxID=670293 RepID=A0A512BIZ0_9BACT|nr:hypothetical protein [Segetibacter aerophilus]GEO11938.1 hypothetical protein SAE01_44340 [Segetibacter aerophilus]